MSLLTVTGLEVAYGHINAVKGVDLFIDQGELICLIGANGAGKTTTLKALVGWLRPAAGQIHYEGEDICGRTVHERVRLGIALVPEGRGIFGRLTVEENLQLGAYTRSDAEAVKRDFDRAYDLFPRLTERRHQQAGTLSGGEQQMLSVARALMSRPRLLLLDEPSMGLAPILVQKIFEAIQRIAQEGVTLLLVEQNAKLALAISDRAYVMESGRITMSNAAPALLNDPAIRRAYLGG